MSSWFYETFLPSLFERAGREPKWLSQKQTDVCLRYMDKHTTNIQQYQGHVVRHSYYTTTWDGRSVTLNYSKMNGCGTIQFGATEEELEQAKTRALQRSADREDRGLVRLLRHHPEKFMDQLQHLKSEIEGYPGFISEDMEAGDLEATEDDTRIYQELKEKIDRMERIKAGE